MEKVFSAEELQVSPVSVTADEVRFLLKVDSRYVMDRLDDIYDTWSKETVVTSVDGTHREVRCVITAIDDKGRTITRDGMSSEAPWARESEMKVRETDAFNRAAMAFGIGRELYQFGDIVASTTNANGEIVINVRCNEFENNRMYSPDEFVVEQVKYDENGKIIALAIRNLTTGHRVYSLEKEKVNPKRTVVETAGEQADTDAPTTPEEIVDVAPAPIEPVSEVVPEDHPTSAFDPEEIVKDNLPSVELPDEDPHESSKETVAVEVEPKEPEEAQRPVADISEPDEVIEPLEVAKKSAAKVVEPTPVDMTLPEACQLVIDLNNSDKGKSLGQIFGEGNIEQLQWYAHKYRGKNKKLNLAAQIILREAEIEV